MSTQNWLHHYQRTMAVWLLAGLVVLTTLGLPMMVDSIAGTEWVTQAHACQHGGGGC